MIISHLYRHTMNLNGVPKLSEELQSRVSSLFSIYKSVLEGEKTGFSIMKKEWRINPAADEYRFNILFIKTNIITPNEYDISDEVVFNFIEMTGGYDFLEKTTHIMLMSCHGGIFKQVILCNPKISIFDVIYSDASPSNFLIEGGDFRSTILLPYGQINATLCFFAQDFLGLRLIEEEKDIFATTENDLNVAIVGGSFVFGVFCTIGESFTDILQSLIHTKTALVKGSKKINIWNFSKPGGMQADYFNTLVHSGLIKKLDILIWIDGLNDLIATIPASSIGLPYTPTLFVGKRNGLSVGNHTKFSVASRLESFLELRSLYSTILEKMNIRNIHILQPAFSLTAQSKNSPDSGVPSVVLRSSLHALEYNKAIPYLQAIGRGKYGLDFNYLECDEVLEFWDSAHLSPNGERVYANALFNFLSKELMSL